MRVRLRLPEIDPQHFWELELESCAWAQSVEKYRRLALLPGLERGRAHTAELRALARRWPGCLREAELIAPPRVRARLAAAEGAQEGATLSRALVAASSDAAGALCLWRELHLTLCDLLSFRSRATGAVNSASFASSLADGAQRERWPSAHTLAARTGPRLRARTAYLWLSARAGLSLTELNFILFARAGHWDTRASDPDWAR